MSKRQLVFVEHYMGELKGVKQHCILCGKAISDYTNAMTDSPGPLPAWQPGPLYQTKTGCPIVTMSCEPDGIMYPDHEVVIEKCT